MPCFCVSASRRASSRILTNLVSRASQLCFMVSQQSSSLLILALLLHRCSAEPNARENPKRVTNGPPGKLPKQSARQTTERRQASRSPNSTSTQLGLLDHSKLPSVAGISVQGILVTDHDVHHPMRTHRTMMRRPSAIDGTMSFAAMRARTRHPARFLHTAWL